MTSPEELQEDLVAALAAGIAWKAVHVYSMEGLLEQDRLSDWVERPEAAAGDQEEAVQQVRGLIQGLDGLL